MTDATVSQSYPLAVKDCSVSSAIGLLIKSLPYALMRFAVLMGFSLATIVWMIVMFGGAAWAGTHIAGIFGFVWFISCAVAGGWFWATMLRYFLHLIECGHVAVLTELIVRGQIGNGTESMFEYGKRIVTAKFGEVNVLFGINLLVRGVVNAVHNTLEGIGNMLPIPGVEGIANLVTAILRAATRYMDKVIFSYNLARGDANPWKSAQDGVVYYAQNAKPILKQAVWIVVLEYALTAAMWVVLLIPAAVLTSILPSSLREMGGLVTIIIAVLFALSARGAFVKPIFLIMLMVNFHTLIEHQPVNEEWVNRLNQLSDKFRDLEKKARDYMAGTVSTPSATPPEVAPAAP
jgi:hypothetical protein